MIETASVIDQALASRDDLCFALLALSLLRCHSGDQPPRGLELSQLRISTERQRADLSVSQLGWGKLGSFLRIWSTVQGSTFNLAAISFFDRHSSGSYR